MTSDGPEMSREERLVRYLRSLAGLRTKTVRDVSRYEHRVWLGRIPEEPECFSRHRDEPLDDDPDLWMEVRKPEEPLLPSPPEECRRWVGEWDRNDFRTPPSLREQILVLTRPTESDDTADEREPTTLRLDDHPAVRGAWGRYIRERWTPWAADRARWDSVQAKYTKLFDIYSHLQTRGEQVELLLAAGLLSWQVDGASVRRHLLVAKVDLAFDERRGIFQIRPHSGGAELTPEFDMMPPNAAPPSLERQAQTSIQGADDDLWDRPTIDPILTSIANLLSDKGVFHPDDLLAEQPSTEHPVVSWAPALIVRARGGRTVDQFLERISKHVAEGKHGPNGWRDLGESEQSGGGSSNGSNGGSQFSGSCASTTHYLPLPANDEQRRILRSLDHPIGALVQGPPGTGKSHTIANLICHLLASGKRILITAQTPRALQVLKDKLPPEIRPLAVSLLGSGPDDQRSLEESVQGITGRFDTADPSGLRRQAEAIAKERDSGSRKIASLIHQRRSIRERDTMVHSLSGYAGTAEQIAKAISRDSPAFAWFTDEVEHSDTHETPSPDLQHAITTLRRLPEAARGRLRLKRPQIGSDLATSATFHELVQREAAAKAVVSELAQTRADGGVRDDTDSADKLRHAVVVLQSLEEALAKAQSRPQEWIDRALHDLLTKRDRPWFELHLATEESLNLIRAVVRAEDRRTVKVRPDHTWVKIRADATTLRQHFAGGGRPRFWLFKPAPIKKCRYLTIEAHVDGLACDNIESLGLLIQHADLRLELERVWRLWEDMEGPTSRSLTMQAREAEELQEALDDALSAYRALESAMEAVAATPGIVEPEWRDSASRARLLRVLRWRLARFDLATASEQFNRLHAIVATQGADPETDAQTSTKLREAIEIRDPDLYAAAVTEIERLERDRRDLDRADERLAEAEAWLPNVVASLRSQPHDQSWDHHLSNLDAALDFARARYWLRVFLDEADLDLIERSLRREQDRQLELLAHEAAFLAWAHCFDRMEETHRRSLMAWQQAMKAVGKGTGKYAARHRREAQRQLHRCRPAIPAWIMPLHRVFETIDPEPGMFDAVIVDEASQCGPDALPLFFLGEKVLIVGDDKQISPSHVGVHRELVHQRMREYLDDFEHKGSFDLERSLFDHGELRVGNRIVLREHFRCMPEIIRFSNDLCYRTTPLVPLRQYPPNRLDPVKAVHIADGYREGDSSNVLNKPEAERLVAEVVRCCESDDYVRDGCKLTMGVISLQGWKQAEHIEHLLLREIGAEEMAERRLVCGDAYSFQGDERDVMFLSMVAAPNAKIGAMTRFADQQRFNVAASRAKDQAWLFHSVTPSDLSDRCMRRLLLEYFLDPESNSLQTPEMEQLEAAALRADRTVEPPPDPFDSWFEIDVFLDLHRLGYRVSPQFPVAGYKIDIVVEGGDRRMAVECDGDHWHGPERYDDDLRRQHQLERAGWTFERVRSSVYYSNAKSALGSVLRRLNELGIRPRGPGPAPESALLTPNTPMLPSGASPRAVIEDADDSPIGGDNALVENDGQHAEVAGNSTAHPTVPDASSGVRVPVTPAVDAAQTSDGPIKVEEYREWSPRPLPDPREASLEDVIDGVLDIVRAEGPVRASRAYLLYTKACGLQRAGSNVRSALNKAVWSAHKDGRLLLERSHDKEPMDFAVLRAKGMLRIRPRTGGSRQFADIPETEIVWVMRQIRDSRHKISREELFRLVLEHYGFQRLRSSTRDRLNDIYLTLLAPDDDILFD